MRGLIRFTLATVMAAVPVLAVAGEAQAATTAATWHMETTSRLVDSSSSDNNGKTTAIKGVRGASGRGYHFNGKTSVATVPDDGSLDPGKASLRIRVKVRFSVVPHGSVHDYDLVRKGVSGAAGGTWKVEIFPPSGSKKGPAYCEFQDSTGETASIRGTRNLADGDWHSITCVKTSSKIQLIVDGSTTSKSVALGSIRNSKPVTIGAKPGGGDRYLGDMDEVKITVG